MSIHKKSLTFIFILFLFLFCNACSEKPAEPAPEQNDILSDQNSNVEDFIPSDDYNFYTAIVVDGTLYDGMAYFGPLPGDAVLVGQIKKITDKPKEELECNDGKVGWNVYTFEFEENTFVGIELPKKNDDGSMEMMIVGMSSSQFDRWARAIRS